MQEQPKDNKLQTIKPLPVISHRKVSSQTEQLPRRTPKIIRTNLKDQKVQNTSDTEKVISHPIFTVPKDTLIFKKRVLVSPNKFMNKKRLYQTLQSDLLKKQIEQLKRMQKQGFCKDQIIFSSALRQFGILQKQQTFNWFTPATIKPSFYQASKKRSVGNQRDRLKPIISELHLKNDDLQFLNVEKMMLIDMSATKKSLNLMGNGSAEDSLGSKLQKQKSAGIPKIKNKIGKETTAYKSRLQKGFTLANEESNLASNNQQSTAFNMHIKTIQIKKNTDENQNIAQTQVKYIQHIQQKPQQQIIQIKKEKYLHLSCQKQQTNDKINKIQDLAKQTQNLTALRKNNRKLNIPFQTYYYRDLIWKVNFSNNLFVEIPLEYEHRLKVFVGKGNNSCMINGLIARRPWYAFTDKIQDANLVWTQLKKLDFFNKQKSQNLIAERQKKFDDKYIQGSILTNNDYNRFKSYLKVHFNSEEHCDERMLPRSKNFKYQTCIKVSQIKQSRMHNHLINNYVLGNKKALFNTMSSYYKQIGKDVFDYLPLTFHIKDGMEDKKYFQFLRYYHKRAKETAKHNQEKPKHKQYNAWIVKPGQNSNRGNGIKMCLSLDEIKAILKTRQKYADGTYRTFIVQAYIQRPLLYNKRKFDIRHYMMMTCINGIIKGYWYKYGYVRTTSSQYSLNSNNGSIHLTNDAVQKNLPDYGKYEKGNKISYDELSAYIQKHNKRAGLGFYQTIYPRMKEMATDAMRACSGSIDPKKLENNFQIFGMDFMIDSKLDVWLIEINTNPCLELSCSLLGCIIPKMVENALELTLDAMFPPPVRYSPKGMQYLKEIQYMTSVSKSCILVPYKFQTINCYKKRMTHSKTAEKIGKTLENQSNKYGFG